MSVDRIAKLYAGLTNKERAVLAFRHLVEQNATEVERIAATVPCATYTSLDTEYLQWLNGLAHLASAWGLEHWQLQTRRLAALCGAHCALEVAGEELASAMIWMGRLSESRLLALDLAIEEICKQHGVAVAAVRQWASAEPFSPHWADVVPDPDFLDQLRESFAALLSSMERKRDV